MAVTRLMATHRFKFKSAHVDDHILVLTGTITYAYGMQEHAQLRVEGWRDLAKMLVKLVVS